MSMVAAFSDKCLAWFRGAACSTIHLNGTKFRPFYNRPRYICKTSRTATGNGNQEGCPTAMGDHYALSEAQPSESAIAEESNLSLKEKLKLVSKQYGKVALLVHSTVYVVSLGSIYLLLMKGVDLVSMLDSLGGVKDWIPVEVGKWSWGVDAQSVDDSPASAASDSSGDVGKPLQSGWPTFGSNLFTPEVAARFAVAWTLCAGTGPLRGVFTVVATPILARKFAGGRVARRS